MKTFLQIIAWIGAGFISVAIVFSFQMSYADSHYIYVPGSIPTMGSGLLWAMLILPLDVIGLVLMLVGGIIAKPKYFWPVSIVLGFLFLLSNYAFAIGFVSFVTHLKKIDDPAMVFWGGVTLPGVILIIEGLILMILKHRKRV